MGRHDALAVLARNTLHALVAADPSVTVGAQRDHAARIASRRLLCRSAVHEDRRPFAIDVEIVACAVDVPLAYARRTTPDLGKLEALGAVKPFHVSGRGPDVERL